MPSGNSVTSGRLADIATLRLLMIRESLRLTSGGFPFRLDGGVMADLKTMPRGTEEEAPDTMA